MQILIMIFRIRNVGVPIPLSFGLIEDTDLCDKSFVTWMEVCSFDLKEVSVELLSDQGCAPRALSIRYQIEYCICLGLFSVKMKIGFFCFQVANLLPH
jgi:hypothetical protein